jgi:hypothetical protein
MTQTLSALEQKQKRERRIVDIEWAIKEIQRRKLIVPASLEYELKGLKSEAEASL